MRTGLEDLCPTEPLRAVLRRNRCFNLTGLRAAETPSKPLHRVWRGTAEASRVDLVGGDRLGEEEGCRSRWVKDRTGRRRRSRRCVWSFVPTGDCTLATSIDGEGPTPRRYPFSSRFFWAHVSPICTSLTGKHETAAVISDL